MLLTCSKSSPSRKSYTRFASFASHTELRVLVTFERALTEHVAMQGKIRWGRTLRTAKYKVEQMRLCLEAAQEERDEVSCCACPLCEHVVI